MSKHIDLTMRGGLGNRIRVINSLLNFLESNSVKDYRVRILWPLGSDLNTPFEDLFDEIEGVRVINVQKKSILFLLLKAKYYFIFHFLKSSLQTYNEIRNSDEIRSVIQGHRKIYLKTVHEFHPISKSFVFFNERMIKKTNIPPKPFTGIHIRQGDNQQSILNSPVSLFEDKIRETLSDAPSTLFYLSTDSADLRKRFKELFKDRVIVSQASAINRDTREGIEDAASEMIILSNAEKIIGSFYSSFSEVAAQFHHIPLIILKK